MTRHTTHLPGARDWRALTMLGQRPEGKSDGVTDIQHFWIECREIVCCIMNNQITRTAGAGVRRLPITQSLLPTLPYRRR